MTEAQAVSVDWRTRLTSALPRMLIGAVLGAIALALAFRGVSWPQFRDAIGHTDPVWIVAGLLSVLGSLIAYTTRWWLLFTPDHRQRNWWNLFAAVLIGQSINIIVPARLGELARTYVAGVKEDISKMRVFATIVIEKVVDLALFAIAVVLLLVGTSLPPWLSRSGIALIVSAVIVTLGALAMAFWGKTFLRIVESIAARLPGRWALRIHDLGTSALQALQFIRSWTIASAVAILSAIVLILSVTTNYVLFKASGIAAPFLAALFLLVILRVGEAPPSLPGKLGIFHYLVVLSLSLFGVERAAALSYAFVLYAVAVIPIVIAGAVLLVTFRRDQARAT